MNQARTVCCLFCFSHSVDIVTFSSFLGIQTYSGEEELCCVYVPTNHLYIGDIFMVNVNDVIRPNLSVREGIGE